MRLRLCFLFFALAGLAHSQDTDFAAGPQYLVPNVSPLFLRSIATPSLSFGPGLSESYATVAELSPSQVPQPLSETPENVYLGDVYWGTHPPSEVVARRVDTPSLTPEQTAENYYGTAEIAENALSVPPSVPIAQVLPPSTIEIASVNLVPNLPPSIINAGVTGTADVQSLLNRGYGVSLGDLASKWKAQRGSAVRKFTNNDLHRD
jgi:hypothetical protein